MTTNEREAYINWLTTTFPDVYTLEIAEHFVKSEHISFLTWQASRQSALKEVINLHDHDDVLAPIGNSASGEERQNGWIEGTAAYQLAIRNLLVKSCEYCDGTGDVHSVTGEWRGECHECGVNS